MRLLSISFIGFILLFSSCFGDEKQEEKIESSLDNKLMMPHPLVQAYPNYIDSISNNILYWKDGNQSIYDDQIEKNFEEKIANPDIEDMLFFPYPSSFSNPEINEDPGRIRNEDFFKKMYGETKTQVAQNLDTVYWLPSSVNQLLLVSSINQVDQHLQQISNTLDTLPHLHKFLQNPGGTFNWRKIAGTDRLSMHSFGITIDINIQYANYWQWVYKEGEAFPNYKNQIPLEIVRIFEKHHFIWGGKWYHFDTMHFEYRPELFLPYTLE